MEARIQKNSGITANGDPNEETGFPFVDLAKKIKNIYGKVLRKAVRGDVITRASPLKVVSFDNVDLNFKSGLKTNSVSNDMGSSNPNPAVGFDGLYSQDVAKGRGVGGLHQQGAPNNPCSQSVSVKVASTVDMNSQLMMVKKLSFASVMGAQPDHKVITLSELRNDEVVEGAAVTLPLAAVDEVNARFTNILYGYFIGKRLPFKLVESYVKNTWAKFGIKRIQIHDEFFLFQFDSKAGMDRVLESGPWLIRRVPLILNMLSPNVELKKDEPIMLDSYTRNICVSSWGRSSYARALIEVSAEKALTESIVIAIPLGKDKGHSLATVEIEYEWKPPRCNSSKLSGSNVASTSKVGGKSTSTSAHSKNIHVENSFSALNDDEENEWKDTTTWQHARQVLDVLNESDSDVDEVITLDDRGGNLKTI
nr:hypothetical protein [Tanacetum cinerariifolium]GEX20943.1 hypothetical protein [Tanacetum cinerariifolium]